MATVRMLGDPSSQTHVRPGTAWVHCGPGATLSMNEPARQNLNVEQWAEAALDAIASGGLEAVSVEALARKLGITKGSFYWHFANRDSLVAAALDLWERRETTDTIRDAESESDPYQRIVQLFKRANASHIAGRLYLALAAASADPSVNAVVKRVSARRLAYLEDCYRALGLGEDDARRWSTFAYATFIGNQQVHRDAPERFPTGPAFREYFKLMLSTLIPRPVTGSLQRGAVRDLESSDPDGQPRGLR